MDLTVRAQGTVKRFHVSADGAKTIAVSTITGGPVVDGGTCCYEYTFPGCCGRPFLVGGEAILAGVEVRADWCAEIQEAAALDPTTRAALALAWLDDARLEHASIASFARFTLHLLALGAPADLVEAAQRASLDEVAHARACFALASCYAGAALGPGALPVEGAAGFVMSREQVR